MTTAAAPAAVVDPPPLRRNRDFLRLWSGVGLATLGNTVTTVAYPLLLIFDGGSAAAAGLVGFAGLLPLLLLQLPAGVFVDRWDRRRTMIVCNTTCAVAAASILVALLAGKLWLPHLMAVAFVEGTAFIFYRLSEQAAVRNVVAPGQLPAALAQNQARGRAAGLLGQPTGSSLFVLAGWAPFLFALVGHLIAVANLSFIRVPFQKTREPAAKRALRAEIGEGISWLIRQRFLRSAILLVSVTNILFNGLRLALVVIIAESGGSPLLLGVIGVVSGIGGISGALLGSYVVRRVHPGIAIIGVFLLWSMAMPLLAFTVNAVLLGALMAIMLFAGALINVIAGVYQVQVTPDRLLGRVGSVASLLSSGANSLGPLIAGVLLGALGGSRTVLVLSAVMAAVTVTAALIRPIREARLAGTGTQPAPAGPALPADLER